MQTQRKAVVTNIRSRRAIYWIDGYVEADPEENLNLYFYEYNERKEIYPTVLTWEGNRFHIYLHVESADENAPIPSGSYYLVVAAQEDETPHTFILEQETTRKREEQEWCEEIQIYKNKGHYIKCASRLDLDTDEFYLQVQTALPKPRQNSFVKMVKEWGKNLKGDYKSISKKMFAAAFQLLNQLCKKRGNRVLFASGSRAELGGNEEFIYNKMVEMGLDRQYKIAFDFKPSVKKTYGPFKMIRFIYRLASADIIIVDDYYPELYGVNFDESVKVVQTWHACGAFKTVGLERTTKPGAPPINTSNHKCYTHVLVGSEHVAYHYQEAFGIEMHKFYPVGVPRTDVFFDRAYGDKICSQLYQAFPRAKTAEQVILYAPTFRGNGAKSAFFPMNKINLAQWGEMCRRTNSYLIVKMHPFVQEKISIPPEFADYIVDASDYREVNDLLFITDVMVTDYSSVIYEFSLLRRPMLFYAFDQKMYMATRDFYEDYEEIVPGKIVKRFDELLDILERREYDDKKLERFIQKNFTYTDGKSSERAVKLIFGEQTQRREIDAGILRLLAAKASEEAEETEEMRA